jgi:hypothetical protein
MKLGVLLRAHKRHKTLDIALSELFRYNDLGLEVMVQLIADRPNFMVEGVISKWRDKLFGLRYTQTPILSSGGERWMENANENLALLEAGNPDWVLFADDDRWFARPQIDDELPAALGDKDIDVYYAKSLFLWDKPDQINTKRHHDAITIWRHMRGARFPTDRVIQAPFVIHDHAIMHDRVGHLNTPLLDYGSYAAEERQELYNAYVKAGRDPRDPWISSLIEPPKLIPLPIQGEDLYSCDTSKNHSASQ